MLAIEKGEQISIIFPVFCSTKVTLLDGEAEIVLGGCTLSNFISFPVGQIKMDQDVILVKHQTDNLSEKVLKNVRGDPHLDASGIIINTAGWIDLNGFRALIHMANVFEVNVILAMGDAVLGHCFKQWTEQNEHKIEVFFVKKPAGLSVRTIEMRRNYRDFIVTTAFRASMDQAIPKHKIIKRLAFLVFYQISSYRKISLPNGQTIAVSNQAPLRYGREQGLAGFHVRHVSDATTHHPTANESLGF
ncbi:hypothetical protein RvY_14311-2 [Ramazzottius varieornatus]|uniref:Clp1 P-loop domain-containing protein n=1 Tax=Ramazzottius varieornatus TaxID=947166 RepID=A0A1D1VQU5_RAMVA|nr:hypothetical protein RvY_14311-2 [Ramazzottius varieornatus]